MDDEQKLERFLVRAEIRAGRESAITYGFDLTAKSVFVVTEWKPPIGSQIALRLSFLDVVPPIDLVASVDASREQGNPGDPSGLWLTFAEEPKVSALLDRTRRVREAPRTDRKYRVLLVEDSGFTRDMFAYGIANGPHGDLLTIDHAESVEHAWSRLAGESYDLVVVDFYLPNENGAVLIRRLRADPRLARIAIVGVSVGGRDAREAMTAAGADLFVDKPLALRDLANTLSIVLDDSPLVPGMTKA
jgi:CheY-like chemotaxis protein